jgi:uncharacterized protein (TIGR02646 family)
MILIKRGKEPAELKTLRAGKLAALRALGREPTSDDIVGYRGKDNGIAQLLCHAQHKKCCYCEQRLKTMFNDVEHYRPKGRADRQPGCGLTHGYWWLAFTWSNLLFACDSCNRIGKKDKFPLAHGSMSLKAGQRAPGAEKPLLLNPCADINPVEHIVFVMESLGATAGTAQWHAHARGDSDLGRNTIAVCKLNCQDLRENRNYHIDTVVTPQVDALNDALEKKLSSEVKKQFDRAMGMLTPSNEYIALSYDAFRHFIPDARLQAAIQVSWPAPGQVGR